MVYFNVKYFIATLNYEFFYIYAESPYRNITLFARYNLLIDTTGVFY